MKLRSGTNHGSKPALLLGHRKNSSIKDRHPTRTLRFHTRTGLSRQQATTSWHTEQVFRHPSCSSETLHKCRSMAHHPPSTLGTCSSSHSDEPQMPILTCVELILRGWSHSWQSLETKPSFLRTGDIRAQSSARPRPAPSVMCE